MVSKELYELIANKYGQVASWALWAKTGEKPKSNISDMSVFDINSNPSTLEIIKTDVVMVALNFSRDVEFEKPFMNFHDANPHGQDYKIRYAFEGTKYYGAYMTDAIKDFPMLSSADVLRHLRNNPSAIEEQLTKFRNEMAFIKVNRPTILAFGKDAYNILIRGLHPDEYSSITQLTHYSHHISKEKYREDTFKKLAWAYEPKA